MFNSCPLCGSTDLSFHTSFPDKMNNQVELAKCEDCQCFIPQYEFESTTNAINQQTSFHEDWWKNSSPEELNKTLEDLTTVVEGFQSCLGEPDPENIVIEIGSGRGSLLRALLDMGYHAFGCEPANGLVKLARAQYSLSPDSLHQMPASEFLAEVIPTLPAAPKTIFLWHVLEHLEQPMPLLHKLQETLSFGGRLILQLPLLSQEYVYPEHYFFVTHNTFEYLSSALNLEIETVDYDSDNLFVTVCFRKPLSTKNSIKPEFLSTSTIPSGMAQGILLRDELIHALRSVIKDRDITIAGLSKMVEEKISSIQSQAELIDERVLAMSKMEQMIQERDTAIRAQAAMIDERDTAIRAQTALIDERDAAILAQAAMIDERDGTIHAQAALIDEKVVGAKKMEDIIRNQHDAMRRLEQVISEHDSLIRQQEALISERDFNISHLSEILRSTCEERDYYKNSILVKIAKKIRILN